MGRPRLLSLLGWIAFALASPAPARTWIADNGNGTYTNPLFFDEFSDPDMIRVGSDFYLTGTTMHSYHDGTYYIFSNVNGQTTQMFRATDPAGPWTRTAMKRSMADPVGPAGGGPDEGSSGRASRGADRRS